MILEIGWNQAKTVSNMLKSAGFSNIYIQKDYAGLIELYLLFIPSKRYL